MANINGTIGNDDGVNAPELIGTAASDLIRGFSGDDILRGNEASDRLEGGGGRDTLYSGANTANFGDGDVLLGGGGNDTLYGIEIAEATPGLGIVSFYGDGGNDTMFGGAGRINSFYGLDGNDTAIGGSAEFNNYYDGSGNDVFDASGSGLTGNRLFYTDFISGPITSLGMGAVTLDLIAGIATDSFGDTDTLIGTFDYVSTTDLNDMIVGDIADTTFVTNDGNDEVFAGDGDDFISSGAGNDIIYGEGGNDRLSGGDGRDRLYGGDGDDELSGGLGDDLYYGDAGDDVMGDASGFDRAIYNMFTDDLTVDLRISGTGQFVSAQAGTDSFFGIEHFTGGRGNDTLSGWFRSETLDGGRGDDRLYGMNGDDTINGDIGDDILRGNNDDDRLDGGLGRDLLGGGAGADTFVFSDASHTVNGGLRDRIQDFEQGTDLIDLSAIDAIDGGADDAFTFVGTGSFSGAGQIRVVQVTALNKTVIVASTDADPSSEFQIELTGLFTLTADDFIL